ncbi:MAG TPA: M48 family metallopeptidase [Acidimicrobiia bacterium]|nr:M48 family metallopeptidase [Acidimicrobiia bacterium]
MYEQIAANRRRTWLMVIAFTVFTGLVLAVVVYLFGGTGPWGIAIAAAIAIATSWFSYWNSDKVALAMSRARPADPKEYARLHNLVEGLCIASGLPKPRVYVVDDPAPNAFATGRDPKHAAIAVTTGLLEKLNRVELEGVLAHELSHIRNYDTLVMTIAVTMVGLLVLVADFFLRFLFWGGARRRDNNNAGAILGLVGIVLLIFAPIIARLMQFAISRRREFLADASGVHMTRYPPGLISALEKLRDDQTVVHSATHATAHLWIEEPLNVEGANRGSKLNRLFATHPPLEERIAVLREM